MTRHYLARTPQQLVAMVSPGRDAIVDAVCNIGPCTIAELAVFLGRSRNGLYYHVRALRDCGIFRESHSSGVGKQRTAHYDVLGRPWGVLFDHRTPKLRNAVLRLANARLRSAARGFERAFQPEVAVVEGPRRNLWASRWTGWLSDSELEEVNLLIKRLTEMFRQGTAQAGTNRKHYQLTFALAPTIPQPPTIRTPATTRRGRSRKVPKSRGG